MERQIGVSSAVHANHRNMSAASLVATHVFTGFSSSNGASSGMLHHVALVRTDRNMHRLLVMANVPSSPILATLMMEALRSSEPSVHTRATWCNIPEDSILPRF
jgi:hypothetical protein